MYPRATEVKINVVRCPHCQNEQRVDVADDYTKDKIGIFACQRCQLPFTYSPFVIKRPRPIKDLP